MKTPITILDKMITECRAEATAAQERGDKTEALKLFYGVHWLEAAKREIRRNARA